MSRITMPTSPAEKKPFLEQAADHA